MTIFEKLSVREVLRGSADPLPWRGRAIIAFMAFLIASSTAGLASVENQFSPSSSVTSNITVLACGSTPGACPNVAGVSVPASGHNPEDGYTPDV